MFSCHVLGVAWEIPQVKKQSMLTWDRVCLSSPVSCHQNRHLNSWFGYMICKSYLRIYNNLLLNNKGFIKASIEIKCQEWLAKRTWPQSSIYCMYVFFPLLVSQLIPFHTWLKDTCERRGALKAWNFYEYIFAFCRISRYWTIAECIFLLTLENVCMVARNIVALTVRIIIVTERWLLNSNTVYLANNLGRYDKRTAKYFSILSLAEVWFAQQHYQARENNTCTSLDIS